MKYSRSDAKSDAAARKCKNCGTIHPGKTPPAGWVKL